MVLPMISLSMTKKINIARNYILPSALKERNLTHDQILIDDDTIKYIIEHYTDEPGVRSLKERLQSIIQRVNYFVKIGVEKASYVDNQSIKNSINNSSISFPEKFEIPFKITPKDVDNFLKFQKPQKENLTYFM